MTVLSYIAFGLATKTALSVDDIIWLGYFLVKKPDLQLKISLIYIACVSTMQIIGVSLGYIFFNLAEDSEEEFEFIVSMVCATFLFCYGLLLLEKDTEWFSSIYNSCRNTDVISFHGSPKMKYTKQTNSDEDEQQSSDAGITSSATNESIPPVTKKSYGLSTNSDKEGSTYGSLKEETEELEVLDEEEQIVEDVKLSSMYIVAFAGALDECIAFTIIALKTGHAFWLLLGGIMATFLMIAITRTLTMSDKIRGCIESFPDYLLFFILAAYLYIDGIVEYTA